MGAELSQFTRKGHLPVILSPPFLLADKPAAAGRHFWSQ
jgi:hypothetical protein